MPGTDTITEPRSPSYTTPGTHPIVIRKPMIGADASGHPSLTAQGRTLIATDFEGHGVIVIHLAARTGSSPARFSVSEQRVP